MKQNDTFDEQDFWKCAEIFLNWHKCSVGEMLSSDVKIIVKCFSFTVRLVCTQ